MNSVVGCSEGNKRSMNFQEPKQHTVFNCQISVSYYLVNLCLNLNPFPFILSFFLWSSIIVSEIYLCNGWLGQ